MPRPPLSLNFVNWKDVKLNCNQVEYLSTNLAKSIYFDDDYELQLLLRIIQCCDVTTLSGDDSISNVRRLCAKSVEPLSHYTRNLILSNVKYQHMHDEVRCMTTGAVCVYPNQVSLVRECLGDNFSVNIASVATGFPSGQFPLESRLMEVRRCIVDGATEVDIVLRRDLVLQGEWEKVYEEVVSICNVCRNQPQNNYNTKVKAIIETGQLGSYLNIYRASMVSLLAGVDTIKTSTGKESSRNATESVCLVMLRAIRDYRALLVDDKLESGPIGFKPAGGVRTAEEAIRLAILTITMLGPDALNPRVFRIGCSSLLASLECRIISVINKMLYVDEHAVTL